MLEKFSEAIRGNLTKNQRSKIVALVTIEVHARDIIDKLYKMGCNDVNNFDWLSQLRLYWEKVRHLYFFLLLLRAKPQPFDLVITHTDLKLEKGAVLEPAHCFCLATLPLSVLLILS